MPFFLFQTKKGKMKKWEKKVTLTLLRHSPHTRSFNGRHQALKRDVKYHRMIPCGTCRIFQVFWRNMIGFGGKQTEIECIN